MMLRKMIKVVLIMMFFAMVQITASMVWAGSKGWPEEVRFGIVPSMGQENAVGLFQPVFDYLSQTLGIRVIGMTSQDYAGIIRALAYKQLDFAFLGPKSYIEATRRAEIEALVMELNAEGEPGYYSILISKKGSGIDSFEKAKNRTFAFTDPNSTSGYLVPSVVLLRDLKVTPKTYFKSVRFSGSHTASILGIRDRAFEVAATNTIDLKRLEQSGQVATFDFNVLRKSDLIPGSPLCGRKDLPESLKKAFQQAMLRFSDKAALTKMKIGGYVKTDDHAYDIIRQLNRLKRKLAAQ